MTLTEQLAALRDHWRAQAAHVDSFHLTMGTGYHTCADELDALLVAVAGSPQRVDMKDEADHTRGDKGVGSRATGSTASSN